jgi:hypothetical protein
MPKSLLVASIDEYIVLSMERYQNCAVPKHPSVIEVEADSMSEDHFHRSSFDITATAEGIG